MKYIISIILFLFITNFGLEGQCINEPPRTTVPTFNVWDWQGDHKYTMYIRNEIDYSSTQLEITSPFFSNNNTTNANISYLQNDPDKDYKPIDGWELIYQNFGKCCSYDDAVKIPSFTLYNKYESILRTFFFITKTNEDYKSAVIRLNYNSTYTKNASGILENIKTPVNSVEDFVKEVKPEVPNSFAQQGGYWLHADFPITYDPCVCSYASTLTLEPILIQSGEIILKFEGGSTIKQVVTPSGVSQGNPFFTVAIDNIQKIIANSGKTTGKGKGVRVQKDFLALIPLLDTIAKAVNASGNGGTQQTNKGGLPKIPAWTKKIPEIGWIFEMADLFVAGGKKVSTPKPTIFEANLEFEAKDSKINTINQHGGNQFYTPGSKQGGGSSHSVPVYDNPLGLITFLTTPQVNTIFTNHLQSYNLATAEYVVNEKAGVRLKDIRGALFFEALNPALIMHENKTQNYGTQKYATKKQVVPAYTKSKNKVVYRTPFLPLNVLNQLSVDFFQLKPEHPKVYLKIVVTLERTDGVGEDIIYVAKFNTKSIESSHLTPPKVINENIDIAFNRTVENINLTEDRTIYAWGKIIVGNNINTNGYQLKLIAGDEIEVQSQLLNPDITMKIDYPIKAKPSPYIGLASSDKITAFCTSNNYKPQLSRRPNQENKAQKNKEKNDLAFSFQAYPSPFTNRFMLLYELDKPTEITIYISDILGKKLFTIKENKLTISGEHRMNINASHLPSGVYFATIQSKTFKKTIKLIKQ